jgi:linoleate 10R-lipoxygenase
MEVWRVSNLFLLLLNKDLTHFSRRLKRNSDGGFNDYELAKILHKATETSACAYGARSIPSVMKAVEVMGIKQARKWGTCTMNEFRQFVGLKKYESFEEWNPTGDIAVRTSHILIVDAITDNT